MSKHHKSRKGVWLVFYKKASGKQTVDYEQSVEEAICYGWIDGRIQGIDEEKYALRFTPRREGGNWSESNKRRALRMLRERKMTQAGKAVLPSEMLVSSGNSVGANGSRQTKSRSRSIQGLAYLVSDL